MKCLANGLSRGKNYSPQVTCKPGDSPSIPRRLRNPKPVPCFAPPHKGARTSLSLLCSPIVASRITIESGKRSGQPCIRSLRITVWDVLSWLAAGMAERNILDDYPELEPDDFRAVYDYAARVGKRVAL